MSVGKGVMSNCKCDAQDCAWDIYDASVAECPDCSFSMHYKHTHADGLYSCPECGHGVTERFTPKMQADIDGLRVLLEEAWEEYIANSFGDEYCECRFTLRRIGDKCFFCRVRKEVYKID